MSIERNQIVVETYCCDLCAKTTTTVSEWYTLRTISLEVMDFCSTHCLQKWVSECL